MAGTPRDPEEQRRRLFRQMEWVFVILPPVIAVAVAAAAGAFLAWLVRVEGTSFLGRWVAISALLVIGPLVAYGVRMLWSRRW
jgi:hypothetical protein